MRSIVYSLIFAAAVFQLTPAEAMFVRTALLFTPGAELSKPAFKWPLAPASTELKTQLDAYKGANADELRAFYSLKDYHFIWVQNGYWSQRAKDLIARFSHAEYDGLHPEDYLRPAFTSLALEDNDEKKLADVELQISAAAVDFARHLSSGRVKPENLRLIWAKPALLPASQILQDMAAAPEMDALLVKYEPPHEGYRNLRTALAKILDMEEKPAEKPLIPGGPVLSEGMRDERVPVLRTRLALNVTSDTPPIMDAALAQAVRSFQQENGLKATGKLNKYTLQELNRQVRNKAHVSTSDIIVNMERWRWLPRDLGLLHVMVNIPEFVVRVSRDDKTIYEGRVVVGKENTPTPVFSDKIEYVVVNPSWNIPPSIIRNEMIPMLQENPDEFFRRGYEVAQDRSGNWRFRQPPSARNALGRVKFIFPNDHDVYLHDTPAKGYFARSARAFSHGCVRVENPLKFADALLTEEPKLTSKRIERLYGGSEQFLHLEKPVPVHLAYFTALAAPDGSIERRADLYGIDARLKSLLGLSKRG